MDAPSKHPGRNAAALGSAALVLTVSLGLGAGAALRDVLPGEPEPTAEQTVPPSGTDAPALASDAGAAVPAADPSLAVAASPTDVAPSQTATSNAVAVALPQHSPPRPTSRATPPPRRVVRIRTRSS